MTGSIKMANDLKGFGFIKRDDGGDLFVHVRDVVGLSPRSPMPAVGSRVEFDLGMSPVDGRTRAVNVRVISGPAEQRAPEVERIARPGQRGA